MCYYIPVGRESSEILKSSHFDLIMTKKQSKFLLGPNDGTPFSPGHPSTEQHL